MKSILVIPTTYRHLYQRRQSGDGPFYAVVNSEGDGTGNGTYNSILNEENGTYTGWRHFIYVYVILDRESWQKWL